MTVMRTATLAVALVMVFAHYGWSGSDLERSAPETEEPVAQLVENTDMSPEALLLISSFREYHRKQDVSGLLTLFCLDNVSAGSIDTMKKALAANFKHSIARIYLAREVPAYVAAGYTMNSIDYRYNLAPARILEIWLETAGGGSMNLSLPVAVQDGRYLIVSAVPQSGRP
jgi:hypothetical protein